MTDDIASLDATGQAELIRTGQVGPNQLVEAALARIDAVNPSLNAVIHDLSDRATRALTSVDPNAPFAGVPMVVKDLDGWLEGAPFHAGTRFLEDHGFIAPRSSWLIERFEAAGLVVVGKTNTPELGLVTTTEPAAKGPTRNPWNPAHSTGGSSGGSAAAVAAGLVPVGHAGDGGGSIRIPASECGLVGLMPTRGRISTGPDEAEPWAGLVRRFAVLRSTRDVAGLLDAVHGAGPMGDDVSSGPPPLRPYRDEVGAAPGRLRIGVRTARTNGAGPSHPACVAAVDRAAAALAAAGHEIVVDECRQLDDERTQLGFITCLTSWVARELDELSEWTGQPLDPSGFEAGTWILAEMGRATSARDYLRALEGVRAAGRSITSWWNGFDLLLTPTISEPPPLLGDLAATPDDPLHGITRAGDLVGFTVPFNISGQPAISLPVHIDDGLPVGVQLVARHFAEDVLIRVASQLEAALGWNEGQRPLLGA